MTKECHFEQVTPDLAKSWLELNHQNRKLSTATVTRLAGVIRRGEWMPDSTDAIGLDEDGGVVNGQHRLSAVIEADTSVEMLVVKGIRSEVIKVIDQGRGRSLTQFLELEGRFGQPAILAGAVDWLYKMIGGHEVKCPESVRPSVPQLLDLLERHKNIEMSIEPAIAVYIKLRLDRKWLAAYHYAMASVNAEHADQFFGQLASGENVRPEQPAFVLRERYVANMAAPESKQLKTPGLIACLVKAWNAATSGQEITPRQLTWRSHGDRPEAFPKIAGLSWLAGDDQLVSD